MNTRNANLWLPIVVLLAASQAQAESLVDGTIEAGKAKSATCMACHGPEGISSTALWPNIAGQNATYIASQLTAFRDGAKDPSNAARYDLAMTPMSMLLTDEDIRNLAVYYESLPAPAQPVADPSTIAKGEALYRGGNMDKGTAACIACHGPTGRGNPAANYPALQGQHAVYTAKQLNDYASGTRTSDGRTHMMRDTAARLDKEEIDALASYVQGLR
jgi:cbb3-type cytochrome c oxidase subunit III